MLFLIVFFMCSIYPMQKQFVSHDAVIIYVHEVVNNPPKAPIKHYENQDNPPRRPEKKCCSSTRVKVAGFALAATIITGVVALIIHFTGK